jgi:phospholipid/cholesterol/gamma-HCH transport system ATP-binding protein
MQHVIEVNNLTSQFGSKVVHEKLNFTVKTGEVMAICGGSGAGKTTLLRQLIMLHRPLAGQIKLFGSDVQAKGVDRQNLRHRFGVMFQRGALFSELTVLANIAFPLQELTTLDIKTINELAILKIKQAQFPIDAIHKLPAELSGGMLKRAALARAIIMDPELVFLDEPTSGLDPYSAASLDDLILNLQQALGLTIVMVSHDVDSLWRAADRVAFLGEQQVLATEAMEQLIHNKHPLIKQYFARNSINIRNSL